MYHQLKMKREHLKVKISARKVGIGPQATPSLVFNMAAHNKNVLKVA